MFLFCLPLLLSAAPGPQGLDASPVVVGYTAGKGFFSDSKIQDFLNQGMEKPIVFRQYSTRCDLLAAVKNGQVDLFYGHLPDLYYIRENQLSYEPLLSVVSAPSSANVGAQTYDVGIVSYDPKIQSIYDLKNQVFAVSSPLSVSGSILPRYLLKAYGIGFRPLEAGSSEEAMKAVLKDKAKAASTWWPSTGAAPSKGRLLLLIHDVPNPVIIAKKGLSRHSLEGYTLIAKLMSMPDLTPDHNHHIFFTYYHNDELYQSWIERLTQVGVLGDLCDAK